MSMPMRDRLEAAEQRALESRVRVRQETTDRLDALVAAGVVTSYKRTPKSWTVVIGGRTRRMKADEIWRLARHNQKGDRMTDQTTAEEREAYELGKNAALAAASWVADGNTDPAAAARLVAMLDDGDPEGYDALDGLRPSLSGEMADGRTPRSLAEELGIGPQGAEEAICDAYEAGVADYFEAECERILRFAEAQAYVAGVPA